MGNELPLAIEFAGRLASPDLGISGFTYRLCRGRTATPLAFPCLAYDVTEQVAARQQVALANEGLQAANQQLARTNADLDNFIYTASHDRKAPITSVEGLLAALREQPSRQPCGATSRCGRCCA
ncbi:MAG: hypothetical protein WKG07_39115 [Hymenobacter sp.]